MPIGTCDHVADPRLRYRETRNRLSKGSTINVTTGLKLTDKRYGVSGSSRCCEGQNNESLAKNIALKTDAQNAFCNHFQP